MEFYLSSETIYPQAYDVEFLKELPRLPDRDAKGHKGTYGTSLIVGGSRGMCGAVALAGCGALVAGSGLVRLVVPNAIGDLVAGFEKEYMAVYAPDSDGTFSVDATKVVLERAMSATALALGPGLGHSANLDAFVRNIFWSIEKPMVVDADALNVLSNSITFDSISESRGLEGPRILTPHPGEFARMAGFKPPDDTEGRKAAAIDFTQRFQKTRVDFRRRGEFILVLKGHETVVTDGQRCFVNKTGNAGMATGGSGDVLTGIMTALLAQSMNPWDAARLAVALHGLAADCAATRLPMESMTASTLIQFFPAALRFLREVWNQR